MAIIIGAAIALLILVIISVLLFDSMGRVGDGTSCGAIDNSVCVLDSESCGDYGDYTRSAGNKCDADDEKCCIPV